MKSMGIIIIILILGFAPRSFAQNSTPSEIVYLSTEENRFLNLINQFRSQLGLPTLKVQVQIQNAAKKHSAWMATQERLSHYGEMRKTPFQRIVEEGYTRYTYLGENVACGNGDAVKTFRQWVLSPGHLVNMINPHFRHIGISRAGTGNERCPYYWTNNFGTLSDLSNDPAPVQDVSLIGSVVTRLTGALAANQEIALPNANSNASATTSDENGEEIVEASTDYSSNYSSIEQNSTPAEFSMIQCLIPYGTAKNILSYVDGLDALIQITPSNSGYKIKITYQEGGVSTNYTPLNISNVSVIKNSSYPIYTIFSAPGSRAGGFTLQYDFKNNTAQFDSYPNEPGNSKLVSCTMKRD